MKTILTFISIMCFIPVNSVFAQDRQIINVGGYHFPPFVYDINEKASGITLDLIKVMNSYQNTYEFKFVLTSSKRRFDHFNSGKYDMILFESIDWGWKNIDIEASKIYYVGGSKYITKAEKGKDQRYFDRFDGKSILLILGYHYGFCNYNTDPNYLKEHYNATMTSTHEGNILSVIKGRSDLTVVIYAYLQQFLHENPSMRNQILISDKYDLRNYYSILIRKGFKPDVKQINSLLTSMENDGTFAQFWSRYGIK